MQHPHGVQRYRETDLSTMTKERMIVLLYEKIVSDLERARQALADGDRVEMTKRANHSQRIVSELRGALDHSVGGEISRNLESLYDFLFHEHLQLIVDLDPVHLDNSIRVVTPLLEAWRQIPHGAGRQAAQERTSNGTERKPGPDPASDTGETDATPPAPQETTADPARPPRNLVSVSA